MSADLVGAVFGLIIGGVLGWLAREEVVRELRGRVAEAEREAKLAVDRLVGAWKEGAKIAPRPEPEPLPPEPLPPTLQEELDHWEDAEHRAMLEARMRAGLQAGKDPVRILLELDSLHP